MEAKKLYDPSAPKKPVNLSANADLLHHAKQENINLSQTFEEALAIRLREKRAERWRVENRDAIAAYNQHIERDGIFGSRTRRF
ncbi:type II toxin-antitoxin system CcdA family antitoxin [Geoalkalibacter sp.]|uniref:type II toxin-antitoxin system CcdA family antitoxin n=1 Tax=Geoalkalibacter sp. TaxID=3041440 RepID=UPI00272E01AE|nr:type II toxin-antitoxin system CcdA family antitoxin [Geoalkalibacter sp.]